MTHSISLYFAWPSRPLVERVGCAAEHGFSSVELWDWRGEPVDECAAACVAAGIELAAFFGHSRGGLANPSERDEVLACLDETLEVAGRTGARQLFMFSDEINPGGVIRDPAPLPDSKRRRAVVEGLQACAELIEGRPIELVLEPMNQISVPGYFLSTAGAALGIVREVDHEQVRVIFDCFHQRMAGRALLDDLRAALPYAAAVHVADVPGRHEPGAGEIDFEGVRLVLDDANYSGHLTFEFVPSVGDTDLAIGKALEVFPMKRNVRRDGLPIETPTGL